MNCHNTQDAYLRLNYDVLLEPKYCLRAVQNTSTTHSRKLFAINGGDVVRRGTCFCGLPLRLLKWYDVALLRRPLTRVSSLWQCERPPYHEWKRRRAVAAAHGRCATDGNTCTLLCRIGFMRGSCKPAAGLSGHLPVSQLEYTAIEASGLQHLRATYEKCLADGRSKMDGVAQ